MNAALSDNAATRPFWQAAERGALVLPKCLACKRVHWYPRALCPFCNSDQIEWIEASGRGTIYSYTVMRRANAPYALAYVTVEEGTTMLTNIVECDFDKLSIGQRVDLVFVAVDGTRVPMFRPASDVKGAHAP